MTLLDAIPSTLYYAADHVLAPFIVPGRLWQTLLTLFLPYLIWRAFIHGRPGGGDTRRLPGVHVAGTDNGKRSLAEARRHFVGHCAEMMLEGYAKVRACAA